MAWTEPGKDKKPEKQNSPEQGPPNLDKIVSDFWRKLNKLFSKKIFSHEPQPPITASLVVTSSIVIALAIIIWGLSGIFIVSPAEQAVILQFGRYKSTVGPGPHWIPHFVQSKLTVNVQKIVTYSYQSQMLTKDQNIVDVSVAIHYRIADAQNYLFNVVEPAKSLQQATASALRQVIGNTDLDSVLTIGRAAIRDAVVQQINQILAVYKIGIAIIDVALQPAKAPEQVKDAFDDAIKAQEDEQRYINQAQAYAKEVVPVAKGKAKRMFEEADAYRQQIVLTAQAEITRYLAILPAYHQAPEVTRKRIYLSAMEAILGNTNKVLMDTKSNQNILYLPFDKWFDANPATLKANHRSSSSQDKTATAAANQANAAENAANDTGNRVNRAAASDTTTTTDTNNLTGRRLRHFAVVNPDSKVGIGKGGAK